MTDFKKRKIIDQWWDGGDLMGVLKVTEPNGDRYFHLVEITRDAMDQQVTLFYRGNDSDRILMQRLVEVIEATGYDQ